MAATAGIAVVLLGVGAPPASADDGGRAALAADTTPSVSGDNAGSSTSGGAEQSAIRGDDSAGLLALLRVLQDPGQFIVDGLQQGVLWLFGWSATRAVRPLASRVSGLVRDQRSCTWVNAAP